MIQKPAEGTAFHLSRKMNLKVQCPSRGSRVNMSKQQWLGSEEKSSHLRAVLRLWHIPASPAGLVKTVLPDSAPRASKPGSLGWRQRMCSSYKFPGGADAAGRISRTAFPAYILRLFRIWAQVSCRYLLAIVGFMHIMHAPDQKTGFFHTAKTYMRSLPCLPSSLHP